MLVDDKLIKIVHLKQNVIAKNGQKITKYEK